jgi:hypothetical protein
MARLLPRGRADLAVQALLFLGGLFGYELVRGLVAGSGPIAYENARRVIDLERALHVFAEPAIERFAQRHAEPLMDAAAWIYLNAHFLVTAGVLAYIYARHRDEFDRTRDTLLLAMAIALVGYALYPTAPPRLLPGFGFSDPVRRLTGLAAGHGTAGLLVNPYAAIPSMHVCFALVLGRAMGRVTRRSLVRRLWLAYPLVIVLTVVVTGNHLFLDVMLGGLTAAVAGHLARRRRAAPAPALGGLPA